MNTEQTAQLVAGDPCEVKICIAYGIAYGRDPLYHWCRGYVVEIADLAGLVRVREVVRGHLVNYPRTHVRPEQPR